MMLDFVTIIGPRRLKKLDCCPFQSWPHLTGMTLSPFSPKFWSKAPADPIPSPIPDPIDPPENPDVPVREPEPDVPGQM